MHDLPAWLRIAGPLPFVGRTSELQVLRTLLPRTGGEDRRVLLLGGEAGAGKTRLAREFAAEAARDGTLVLYGQCDAVVPTPYGPFVAALEQLLRAIDPDELTAIRGVDAGELSRLMPELAARTGGLAPQAMADPDNERHRLHSAVTHLLAEVSQRRPVLLVLEDVHWADAPTVLLLRHLAQAAWTGRALVFATFRDADADLPELLSRTLADLRRSDDVLRLRLAGLTRAEVIEFVTRAVEGHGGDDLAEIAGTISDLTGGNAFLVCELWRALLETGAVELVDGSVRLTRPMGELGTPDGVREVVSERLARLAPTTTSVLELAATAGAEFELEVVLQASSVGEDECVAALDDAIRSAMIEQRSGRRLTYRFTHELVRRAVYDRLTAARKAQLHLRVGEALEAISGRSARGLADLAHHFAAAAPLGEVARAIDYGVLAAQAAIEALAFDEAAELLRTVLELGVDREGRRGEVLRELGTANHLAGKSLEAMEAFRAAAEIARTIGDPELLAQAAIGHEEACGMFGLAEGDEGLLKEAIAALVDRHPQLRLALLGGLARTLDQHGRHGPAAVVRADAIALARGLGDRRGLANVLVRSYWARGAIPNEELSEMLTEAKAIGEELGDPDIQGYAMSGRVPTFVALADMRSARREVTALRAIAQVQGMPFVLHIAEHFGAAIALADGRLAAAETMMRRSEEAERLLTRRYTSGIFGIQMFSLRREQGRLAQLAPAVRILAAGGRDDGAWRPGLVSLLVELGMEAEARRELARFAGEGLDPLRQSLWLASLTYLSDACAALGDEAIAALVYPELAPHAGTNVMIGALVACYGAADRYLGMLATTLGEWDRAEEHFERAIELNRQMQAATWLAHTKYEYARLVLAARPRQRHLATTLLQDADKLATAIGMASLRNRIRALGAPSSPPALPDELSAREAQILRLVARGLSNRQIGAELFISEHTAANHIRSILRKTGCANRTDAASYAHRHALVDAEPRG